MDQQINTEDKFSLFEMNNVNQNLEMNVNESAVIDHNAINEMMNVGKIHLKTKSYAEALRFFNKVYELDESRSDVRIYLIQALKGLAKKYELEKHWPHAIELYKKCLHMKPESQELRDMLFSAILNLLLSAIEEDLNRKMSTLITDECKVEEVNQENKTKLSLQIARMVLYK